MKEINPVAVRSVRRRDDLDASAQQSVWHKAAMMCSCVGVLLLLVGCGSGASTIDSRLASDGYTPEKLVREIQIQFIALESPNSRRSKESSRPTTFQEDHRRGPEREKLTFESATQDIKSKIAALQAKSGEDVDVLAEVIAGIEQSDMSASLKEKIIKALG